MVYSFCLLVLAAAAYGQIPTSSPALDPDFVVLQPKEEFTGRYANQSVGAVIHTVAPLRWDIPEGGVFLNNVDTAGYPANKLDRLQPTGPFLQNENFSLFNPALFRLTGLRDPSIVFSKGKDSFPVIVGTGQGRFQNSSLFFYFPDSNGAYRDSMDFIAFTTKAYLMGGFVGTGWAGIDVNNDGFDDLLAAEEDAYDGDSTSIGLWYSNDIVYRGDTTISGLKIIPATREWNVPNRLRGNQLVVRDLDKDAVVDICYRTEERIFMIVFGKLVNEQWEIDTVVTVADSAIRSFLFMDFLHEDGIQDLLIGTDDTIYCFSGHKPDFLRNGFSFGNADFRIPSPAKLDPKNFKGNGNGMLYEWGWWMHNAGTVNGSGQHSLAVLCYLSPDTSQLGGPTYCFIYSGGKAADEKADAIVADNSSIYVIFLNLDTVQTSDASFSDILLGDPFHTAGRSGKLYYFKGRADIPHKPNPQWSVAKSANYNNLHIECSQIAHGTFLQVHIHTLTVNAGTLILRDILGRTIREITVPDAGTYERLVTLPIDGVTNGSYVLQYIENNRSATKQIFIIH